MVPGGGEAVASTVVTRVLADIVSFFWSVESGWMGSAVCVYVGEG